MINAFAEAKKARKKGEVPVGATIVKDDKIISRAHNLIISDCDPTAHAEILAIKKASKALKNERLNDTTLYCTVEPCSMCAGAMVLARIEKLVFGTKEKKTGAAGSIVNIVDNKQLNHRIEVKSGLMEREISALMKKFFEERRIKKDSRLHGNDM